MERIRGSARVALLSLTMLLAACARDVVGAGDAALSTDVAPDASPDASAPCVLSDGTLCPRGQTCTPESICGVCMCSTAGVLTCVPSPCIRELDAGMPPCTSSADCSGTQVCAFHAPGCGSTGVCERPIDCDIDLGPYCGCDGLTHAQTDCNGPSTPYTTITACACTTNADCHTGLTCLFDTPGCGISARGQCGTPPPCAEPRVYCACDGATFLACEATQPFEAEGACLPPSSVDCSPRDITCDPSMPPPPCGTGFVRSVTAGCFGACVPFAACAPIPCNATLPCPSGLTCDPSAGTCASGG